MSLYSPPKSVLRPYTGYPIPKMPLSNPLRLTSKKADIDEVSHKKRKTRADKKSSDKREMLRNADKGKVISLAHYRIRKSLETKGFELIAGEDGHFRLLLRISP